MFKGKGRRVGQFFEQQSASYMALYDGGTRDYQRAASAIEGRCAGRTICIGGLWPGATPSAMPTDLTIVDLSPKMLSLWADFGAAGVCADARRLPMDNESVDTIIYPMMLHHVCDGTAKSAQTGVRDVFREAYRVLAPGGRLLIFDWAVPRWVYALELTLSGVTSRLLALTGIPLVVMHSTHFYEGALTEAGFVEMENVVVSEDQRLSFGLVRPIIGLSWFAVPRFAYPVSQLLLAARRRADTQWEPVGSGVDSRAPQPDRLDASS